MRIASPGILLLLLDLLTAPVSPPGFAAASSVGTADIDPNQRIRDLKEAAKRSSAPDSLRYELALAYRAAGTIEDRRRALDLLDVVRRSYGHQTRYHWDKAMLFEECQQPSRARQCLEDLLEIDPGNVPAKIEIARVRLRELLYHYDLTHTEKMLVPLRSALADDPDNRDALFLSSLALELAGGLPQEASPELTAEGIANVEKILSRDPVDLSARLLLAVHRLDIGQLGEAERQFEAVLAAAPEDLRLAFASSRWTAPEAAVSGLAGANEERRAAYDEVYWGYHDPTPLTLMNENQLEIWKRLVLADFLFGRPREGRRGWETDPGEALVRFGAPVIHTFDPGGVLGGPEPDVTLPPAGVGMDVSKTKGNIKLKTPALTWGYTFRGLNFSLKFQDVSLNGRYILDDSSARKLAALRQSAPVVFHEAPPGSIRNLYLASTGVAGSSGKVRQSVDLGVPLWRHPKERDWLDRVRADIVVRDSTRTPVRWTHHQVAARDVYPLLPDLDVLLVSVEYDLAPGRYTVNAFVEDEEKHEHGEFTCPIVVRDYAGEAPDLVISDLELGLGASPRTPGSTATRLGQAYAPNPLCLVGDDRQIDVFYELYGLSAREGVATSQIRYTVLPRQYVLGFERYVREGLAPPESLVSFTASGLVAGGIELGRQNYTDVLFPAETTRVDEGRARKGLKAALTDLAPGEYALIVTVTDKLTEATASAQTFFRVLTDEQLRELLAYSGR